MSAVRPRLQQHWISWLLLAALVAIVSTVFDLVGLPTPLLFGGLAGALAYALARPRQPLTVPTSWFQAGQAIVGVIVGATIDWDDLAGLGASWIVVVLVGLFSLVVSVLLGQLLVRKNVSRVTATFSSIAGGAAGLTAIAHDLGADARVVAVLQYLRLLVVLVTLPIVVTVGFGATDTGGALDQVSADWKVDLPFALISIVVGLYVGKLLRFPSSAILGPLVVASLLTLAPYFEDAQVPAIIEAIGYLAIGVQVGLRFTVASLRSIGKLLPTALFTIVLTMLACAALGWVLTLTTDESALDSYLATNPGGIYAVLGIAASTGGDASFVSASQVVRLLVILGSAPFVSAYLHRYEARKTREIGEGDVGA